MADPGVGAPEPSEDALLVRIRARPAVAERSGPAPAGGARSARTRSAVVRAATELFLRQGFQATSTEQIAAAAAVSKQTVYNQFTDKQALFGEIILGVTATAEAFADRLPEAFAAITTAEGVRPGLEELAHRWLLATTSPQVLALRRLVVGEATRFPELAATYFRRAPARVLAAVAEQLERLDRRGLLAVDDPTRAADDLAYLLLGRVLDEGMFHPGVDVRSGPAAADLARHAVHVFLAVHAPAGPDAGAGRPG